MTQKLLFSRKVNEKVTRNSQQHYEMSVSDLSIVMLEKKTKIKPKFGKNDTF